MALPNSALVPEVDGVRTPTDLPDPSGAQQAVAAIPYSLWIKRQIPGASSKEIKKGDYDA